MDKNNLIQKLQNGGSVVQLEEYVPGKILEKAVADTIEYARYNRDFEEEQRQFDERMQVEKDRVTVAKQQNLDNKLFNNAQLQLKDEELKRNDFIEFGSKMPPQAQLAYAKANDMPADMIEYATNLNTSWNKFQQDYKILKSSPTTSTNDWKEFKNRNISNFSMFKNFAPNLESEIKIEHQGRMNKDLLVSMIDSSPKFVEQMGKLGINVSSWKDLDPAQATSTLKQLPSYISTGMTGRKLDIADEELTQNMLTEMLKYSTAAFQSGVQYDPAQANEFLGSMNTIMNEMFTKRGITKDLGLGTGDDTPVTLTDEEMQDAAERESRTGVIQIGTGDKVEEKPVEFEKGSNYRIQVTDASGKTSTKTVKGSNVADIQRRQGWTISKSDKIIKPLSPAGRPQLDSGVVLKDTKTGKVLEYVGHDLPPEEGAVSVSGKKIKRSRISPTPAGALMSIPKILLSGGNRVLYFKDEAGKTVIYTPQEAFKTNFIEAKEGVQSTKPAVKLADKPKEETKIPLSPSGSVAASGMEGRGDEKWDTYKAQVDSVQQAIDAYLEEDASLQEIEDNE